VKTEKGRERKGAEEKRGKGGGEIEWEEKRQEEMN
jgi:hypothetical protein